MTFCSVDIYVITGAFFVYFLLAEKVIGRKFEITEYGICFIEDILDDIPDSVIKVWTYWHRRNFTGLSFLYC